jgi:CheY-like chemotaxis protein
MPDTKAKILVIEDDADEAQMVRMILEPLGYEVALAEDGKQGLERVRTQKPDLVILDVMMPVLDGFATCTELRKDAQCQDLPVILLTGVAQCISDTKYPLDGVLRAEATDYLAKPVDPADLVAAVARYVG